MGGPVSEYMQEMELGDLVPACTRIHVLGLQS